MLCQWREEEDIQEEERSGKVKDKSERGDREEEGGSEENEARTMILNCRDSFKNNK